MTEACCYIHVAPCIKVYTVITKQITILINNKYDTGDAMYSLYVYRHGVDDAHSK